jgi:hypothetical protein
MRRSSALSFDVDFQIVDFHIVDFQIVDFHITDFYIIDHESWQPTAGVRRLPTEARLD